MESSGPCPKSRAADKYGLSPPLRGFCPESRFALWLFLPIPALAANENRLAPWEVIVSEYYCHRCSVMLGLVKPEVPESLTGTSYQLEKFIKHTAPTGTYPINSLFSDPSYERYRDFVATTIVSGSAYIDDRGRSNLLYFAGDKIGATYEMAHKERTHLQVNKWDG